MVLLRPKKHSTKPKNATKSLCAGPKAAKTTAAAKPQPKPQDVFVRQVDVLQHAGTKISERAPQLAEVVRCQTSDRIQRKHSALTYGGVGGTIGLFFGALAGPFFPVVGAGAALVGAAIGAAVPWKEAASFQQVRKHLFFKVGIVPTRDMSATLVAALKKAKILNKGRGRDILALENLDAVLAKQPYLNSKQRKEVRECLAFIAQEAVHFDALSQERVRLKQAIDAIGKKRREDPRVASALSALYARQSQVEARLRVKAKNVPQHMHIPKSI